MEDFNFYRNLISVFLVLFFVLPAFSLCHEIKESSIFTINGQVELRVEPVLSSKIVAKTLNHEGGLKVRVLKVKEAQNGTWIYVLVRSGFWSENGDWNKPYSKYWLFLEDETKIFDYEEWFLRKNTVDLRRMRRAAVGGEAANEGYRTQSSRFFQLWTAQFAQIVWFWANCRPKI